MRDDRPSYRPVRRFGADPRRDLDAEIEFHLDAATRDLIATGLSPAAAREEALRRFGDPEAARGACLAVARRRRRGERLRDLGDDVRYALRSLGRSRGFTAAALLTLALGIGAASAIFSVVYGVVFRPLPFPEPGRLAMLWEKNPERDWMFNSVAPANFLDWRERGGDVFADVTSHAFWVSDLALTGGGEPVTVRTKSVFGNYFSVLGVEPALGRGFREEESWEGADLVTVLADGLWRRRFGGDPGVLGREIELEGRRYTVIGVMPPSFSYPDEERIDVWIPFGWDRAARGEVWFRRAHFVWAIARLAPGVTPEEADARLEAIAGRLEAEYPETNRLMGAGLTPLHEWVVGDTRRPLLVLLAAVGVLLAIACVNVANLQLARATARRPELAVRGCLGAGRGRLVRQLLAESGLLALAGGAAGVALGFAGTRALLALAPADLPRTGEVRFDGVAVGFALAVTALAALASGLAPALRASAAEPAAALGGSSEGTGRATGGRRGQRGRSALVVAELALAVVLVAGAGLLARSLLLLGRVDPGFRAEGVITAGLNLPETRYSENADVVGLFDRALARIRALPGVEHAGAVSSLPLDGTTFTSDFAIEGRDREDYGVDVHRRFLSPGYFEALGVPVVAGRAFGPGDDAEATPVVMINETLARRHFAGEDPIGARIATDRYPDEGSLWRTVIGVVGDERIEGLATSARDELFHPIAQAPRQGLHLVAAGPGDPKALIEPIRREIAALDPDLPLYEIRTLEEIVAASVVRERFVALLVSLFAAVAAALAAIGVYGVLAYAVTRRTRELGIRMALGAAARDVFGLVLRRALAMAAAGLALGIGGALLFGRLLSGLLYGVEPADPATLGAVAAFVLALALAAALLPGRRAASVEPSTALRQP